MNILEYNDLNTHFVKQKYQKILSLLKKGNYTAAQVKKLVGTPFYRAKLDHTNRLLFKIVRFKEQTYLLMLEIIENHAYDRSRFLKGAEILEEKTISTEQINAISEQDNPENQPEILEYLNLKSQKVNILNKTVSFDEIQNTIYQLPLPSIIIGSAGSGKTILTLEKLKHLEGDILYVSHSDYLVKNARNLYYSNDYENSNQNLAFLSYHEFLETFQIPETQEMAARPFFLWAQKYHHVPEAKFPNRLFEEFKGVLTGTQINQPFLTEAQYLALGVKQSIYSAEEKLLVYSLFEKYLDFLKDSKQHDLNILSFEYLAKVEQKYDVVVIDEIQDFTLIQFHLILKTLKYKGQFLLCGDSNQIVHPNFFSWSKIKTYFYEKMQIQGEITQILTKNYRNGAQVVELANRVLKLKGARFGSIDKESNYLVEANPANSGIVQLFLNEKSILKILNEKTRLSTKFAVLVLEINQKKAAELIFDTPLIFTIQEAKGLEYENVILCDFM